LVLLYAVERFQAQVIRDGWRPIPELLEAIGLAQTHSDDST
jgi:hypothetical protein